MQSTLHKKISIHGSKKDVEKAMEILSKLDLGIKEELEEHPNRWRLMSEAKDRLKIQEAIDVNNLKASILYDGNGVWSKKRILQNLRRIIEHGTLYGSQRVRWIPLGSMLYFPATPRDFKPVLSKYFYEFLHLCCGSIAHYNRAGWIAEYPTVEDLKTFFKKNEYGKRVLDHIPRWKTDAKVIVEAIEAMLFPFQYYMKQKATIS